MGTRNLFLFPGKHTRSNFAFGKTQDQETSIVIKQFKFRDFSKYPTIKLTTLEYKIRYKPGFAVMLIFSHERQFTHLNSEILSDIQLVLKLCVLQPCSLAYIQYISSSLFYVICFIYVSAKCPLKTVKHFAKLGSYSYYDLL